MMQWLGGGHVNPDVRGDVWLRLNLALSERGGCRLEAGQRNRPIVVQEWVPIPRKANG